MSKKSLFLSALLLSTSLAAGCGDGTNTGNTNTNPDLSTAPDLSMVAAPKDVVDTAVAAGTFKTLVAAVQAAGLETTLRGTGPFTVLAPTDTAFAKLPTFLSTQLLTAPYKTELGLILTYHVVSGSVKSSALLGKTQDVASLAPGGAKLNINGSNNKVVINSNINVTTPDVEAKNGLIHIVDSVILPSIVDTAVGYKDGATEFKTLVAAVTAADLVPTLSGPGTFTVFAPTDAAFAALKTSIGDAKFNALLADKVKLGRVLKYHVLGATAYAKDVKTGMVDTVAGGTDKLTLNVGVAGVTITDSTATAAKVVFTDLPNRNGVIHVIDKVLIPANLQL